jgi:hypothetical protein
MYLRRKANAQKVARQSRDGALFRCVQEFKVHIETFIGSDHETARRLRECQKQGWTVVLCGRAGSTGYG